MGADLLLHRTREEDNRINGLLRPWSPARMDTCRQIVVSGKPSESLSAHIYSICIDFHFWAQHIGLTGNNKEKKTNNAPGTYFKALNTTF